MNFFLGTHMVQWLAQTSVPLFVSRRRLAACKALPVATAPWAMDSGGFTELSMHGRWTVTPEAYVAEVRRCRDAIGGMFWAAPQDWMCEPAILAKTGKTVDEHQRLTIENYLTLRSLAPELPIIPVLQGWSFGDYMRHVEQYDAAGVDLRALPLVGVGTVCRRQGTASAGSVMAVLHAEGLRLHGFGFKRTGLKFSAQHLESADSLAWSLNARLNAPLPGHTHKSCANCLEWALLWRDELHLEAA